MNHKGFTLVELLVVLAVFAILFAIVGAISYNTLPKNQLSIHADRVEETLRKAQARTISQHADGQWGVHFSSSDMTLFQGATYAGRDTAYDDLSEFPSDITASGLTDVVFEFRTGTTTNTGIITLTASSTGESIVLTVNAAGSVEK